MKPNYPTERFTEQKASLLAFMKQHGLDKGDDNWLTHVPGVGFHCKLQRTRRSHVRDVPFAVAI